MMMEDSAKDPLAELGTNRVEDCFGYTSKETCKDIEFPEFGDKIECVWKENNLLLKDVKKKCGVFTKIYAQVMGVSGSEDEYRCRNKRRKTLETWIITVGDLIEKILDEVTNGIVFDP